MAGDQQRIAINPYATPESYCGMLSSNTLPRETEGKWRAIVKRDLRHIRPGGKYSARGNPCPTAPIQQSVRLRHPAKPLQIANDRVELRSNVIGELAFYEGVPATV